MKIKNRPLVNFPNKKKVGKRIWGNEWLLVLIPKVLTLKLLEIKKSNKGGLQFHRKKNECGFILSGKLKVTFQNKSGKLKSKILKKGDSFHFPPGSIHQEEAITNCSIIEASSPHFNDRVRVEKFFNLFTSKGLPSTKLNEIIYK